MESKTNYTVVGLMVLILSFGLLTAALWLSIGFEQKSYNKYTVYVRESVAGLGEQSIIKYNGVKVGYVDQIQLSHSDPQLVNITLKIEEGTPITTSTQATLITQGITGTTYMGLSAASPSYQPLTKMSGERYPIIPYKPSFFNQLEKNLTEISDGMKRVLNTQNAASISQSLHNLEVVTNIFAKNEANIDKLLHEFPSLTQDLHISIERFTTMANNVSKAGKQVSSTMKAGRASIDKFSQQALPPAIVLLRRLDTIAANLEQMSTELRQNPSVIIRGSAPPKPGPGERR